MCMEACLTLNSSVLNCAGWIMPICQDCCIFQTVFDLALENPQQVGRVNFARNKKAIRQKCVKMRSLHSTAHGDLIVLHWLLMTAWTWSAFLLHRWPSFWTNLPLKLQTLPPQTSQETFSFYLKIHLSRTVSFLWGSHNLLYTVIALIHTCT